MYTTVGQRLPTREFSRIHGIMTYLLISYLKLWLRVLLMIMLKKKQVEKNNVTNTWERKKFQHPFPKDLILSRSSSAPSLLLKVFLLGLPTPTAVSMKYIGLADKSSKKWFSPVKIGIGPVKNQPFYH